MEIHQLKTFIAVAREGSITRASEQLYLSQPAVSAHIKAIEDTLNLILFERTPKGMSLTLDGERLLAKAELTLAAHRELLEEATRIKGSLTGKLRIGAGGNVSTELLGRLLVMLSERCPEVDVSLQHGSSQNILKGVRDGNLDGGFYNESGTSDIDLATTEISSFGIYLAAPPEFMMDTLSVNWQGLEEVSWICPPVNTCCGVAAERLFKQHNIQPKRMISIDSEKVTRTLIAGGVGVGLLHGATAKDAEACGEFKLLCQAQESVSVLFAYLKGRDNDPLLLAVNSILERL